MRCLHRRSPFFLFLLSSVGRSPGANCAADLDAAKVDEEEEWPEEEEPVRRRGSGREEEGNGEEDCPGAMPGSGSHAKGKKRKKRSSDRPTLYLSFD